jgi:hypothetical protein
MQRLFTLWPTLCRQRFSQQIEGATAETVLATWSASG